MSVRLTEFTLTKGKRDKIAYQVCAVLNDSYVRDTTAKGLLNALAKDGHKFKIDCSGDYHQVLDNTWFDDYPLDDESKEWYSRIKESMQ